MGFAEGAAAAAAAHVLAEASSVTAADKRKLRDRAVDWLCLTLPEEELPLNFQVKQRVQIVRAADLRRDPPATAARRRPRSLGAERRRRRAGGGGRPRPQRAPLGVWRRHTLAVRSPPLASQKPRSVRRCDDPTGANWRRG